MSLAELLGILETIRSGGINAPPIEFDWQAYYREFEKQHFGSPVLYNERLLFRDGWMYAAYAHEGPEWPPPENPHELRRLQRVYWELRLDRLEVRRKQLDHQIESLSQLQGARNVPLQVKGTKWDEVDYLWRYTGESAEIDLTDLKAELGQVIRDIEECRSELGSSYANAT